MFSPQNFIPVPKSSQQVPVAASQIPQIHTVLGTSDPPGGFGAVLGMWVPCITGRKLEMIPHFFLLWRIRAWRALKTIFYGGFHGYIWTIYGPFLTGAGATGAPGPGGAWVTPRPWIIGAILIVVSPQIIRGATALKMGISPISGHFIWIWYDLMMWMPYDAMKPEFCHQVFILMPFWVMGMRKKWAVNGRRSFWWVKT